MNILNKKYILICILILTIIIVLEVGKSIRISQLKGIEESKIESIGKYEEKSKNDYLKTIDKAKNTDEN